MNFSSDNVAGVSPEILAALAEANHGRAASYGADEITARLEKRIAEVFERQVWVMPLISGTAANALALASLVPAWGMVYCHEAAHVATHECGALEFYSGGARIKGLPGAHGRITAGQLADLLPDGRGVVYATQPSAISLTQATEAGTAYTCEEIAAIAEVGRAHGLALHMDGARFANALVHLGVAPADMTWKAGVEALSFGATKNGAMGAEALIFFDERRAAECAFRRMRAGHLVSKMRFLSAQLEAYLTDDLWLRNARHANAMAQRLAARLTEVPGARLSHPVEANEVFAELPEAVIAGLEARGFQFYRWNASSIRLVTAFDTPATDVDGLIAAARELADNART
jgi:threonine aldolase